MANETMNNYTHLIRLSTDEFMAAAYGTFKLTGTTPKTGNFAGFQATEDTVIAAMQINGVTFTPASAFGTASIEAGGLRSVAYMKGQTITSITLTSGSIILINAK